MRFSCRFENALVKCVTIRVNSAEEGAGFSTDDGVGLLLMPVTCDAEHPHALDALTAIRENSKEAVPCTHDAAPIRQPKLPGNSAPDIQEVSIRAPGPLAPPTAPDEEGDEVSDFTDEDEEALNEDEVLVLGGESDAEDLSDMWGRLSGPGWSAGPTFARRPAAG